MTSLAQLTPATQATAPTTTKQQSAAIYTRVSTQGQADRGYSLEAQERDCRKLADSLGLSVVAVFSDTESGASSARRGYAAMLGSAKRGDFGTLICYSVDRFARDHGLHYIQRKELEEAGVGIRYVQFQADDTPQGRFIESQFSNLAEFERSLISGRTNRGRWNKAAAGLVVGVGTPPYGYRYTYEMVPTRGGTGGVKARVVGLEPDDATAPIVRRIFAEAAYQSINDICAGLIRDGVPAYRGGAWQTSSVRRLLTNTVYIGVLAYGKRDTITLAKVNGKRREFDRDPSEWLTAAVPPLVAQAAWDAAQTALARRKKGHGAQRPAADDPYSLRGMLTCAHCGGVISVDMHSGVRYYLCLRSIPFRAKHMGVERCPLPLIPAKALEAYAWELVTNTVLSEDHLARQLAIAEAEYTEANEQRNGRIAIVEREVTRLRTRLARLMVDKADAELGSPTADALTAAVIETDNTIRRLAAELTDLRGTASGGLSPAQAQSLREFAADVRKMWVEMPGGWDAADQRHVYQLLQLAGRLRYAPESGDGTLTFGKHQFYTDWQAALRLVDDVQHRLCCGILNEDLIVRVGTEAHAAALASSHVRPFDITGRPMKGWVLVGADGYEDDAALDRWVQQGLAFALTLPPK